MSEENNDNIDDIIDALKEKNVQLTKEIRKVSKENLEEFVIDSAGSVINECVDLVKNLGIFMQSAPNAKDLSAYAELINASANAIETLNKIIVQDKKGDTLKDLKKMDHNMKKDLLGDAKEMLSLSREDMFKKLKDIEIVEIKSENTTETSETITASATASNTSKE